MVEIGIAHVRCQGIGSIAVASHVSEVAGMDGHSHHILVSVRLLQFAYNLCGSGTVQAILSCKVLYQHTPTNGSRLHIDESLVFVDVVAGHAESTERKQGDAICRKKSRAVL